MRSVMCFSGLLFLELWTGALVLVIYVGLDLGFKGQGIWDSNIFLIVTFG